MPKISVIVPVYNVEKYLSRCIDSILNQSYADFELLLINDGSTDNSASICNEYEKKDSRIRVFHKENGGVSTARNLGIENAKGRWICFIDSDDWIEKEYFNAFNVDSFSINTLKIQLYKQYNENLNGYTNLFDDNIKSIVTSNDIEKYNIFSFTAPWCKLYCLDLIKINSIRFNPNISLGEDGLFFYEYLKYIDSIDIIEKYLYVYSVGTQNSLTMKYHELSKVLYYLNRKSKYVLLLYSKFGLSDKYLYSKVAVDVRNELFNALYRYKDNRIHFFFKMLDVDYELYNLFRKSKTSNVLEFMIKYIILLKINCKIMMIQKNY